MRFGKKLIAAAAASVMMMGTAAADWEGLYAGVYAGPVFAPGGVAVYSFNSGAQAGYNIVPGNYVIGFGFDAGPAIVGGAAILCCTFNATIRAGALVSPDVLVYALAGVGNNFLPGFTIGSVVGIGAELAIGQRMGIFAEIRRAKIIFGAPPATALPIVRIGVNIH